MERIKLLILRLTDRCNLSCRYCYAACGEGADRKGTERSDMTPETAKQAVDLFAQPGDKLKIQFTGGEPLLCLDLMEEIFQYGKYRGIQVLYSLQTNGTLLTPMACKLLKEMGCAIGVSLDGMGEGNGLRIHPDGKPAFEEALEGIQTLRSLGMYCNLNAVVTRQNQAHLAQLIELAAYLGNVRGVGLDMFRPLGRGREKDLSPDLSALSADIERMLEKREELQRLGVNIRIKELEKVRSMQRENRRETCYCYAQTGLSAAVDPRGDLYPCSSFVGMPDLCMGNVKTGISFAKSLSGLSGKCLSCADAAICRGGCPAGRIAHRACSEGDCQTVSEADCLMHRTIIHYASAGNQTEQ